MKLIDNLAEKGFLSALSNAQIGTLALTTPEGKRLHFGGTEPGPEATMQLHRWDVLVPWGLRGDIGIAETYRDGGWDSDDLEALMQFGMLNEEAMNQVIHGTGFFRAIDRFVRFFQSNTLRGSKRNISAHYDLGNEFYRLWLDDSMTYSSALYDTDEEPLLLAQQRKYDRILDTVGTTPGEILEIGCGWGGFGERAIERADHRVSGLTLSTEQHSYAEQRLKPYGENAAVHLRDYRKETGKYDHIVSIEMFEAVGERYWKTYFEKVASSLKQGGTAVIQTITIDEPFFESYRKCSDMIRTFIFPGGMLPSPSRFTEEAGNVGLKLADSYRFGQDYARTLRQWLKNFQQEEFALNAMGYDSRFRRLWSLYLAVCAASFAINRTDVYQMELVHA